MPTTYWINGSSYTLPDGVSDEEATRMIAADRKQGAAQPGNIDLHSRPVVNNPDGSISTVRSKSFGLDGKEVLLPTVSDDGRIMSDAETVDQYRRTGKHLGMFNSPDEATAYAQKLHEQQAAEYLPKAGPSVADTARQRLATRGLTTEDVKAGKGVTDVTPTIGERMKSGAGSLVSGLGDLAGGTAAFFTESPVNLATAIPRSYAAGVKAIRAGGGVGDAIEAAKNVQPMRGETEYWNKAATDLGHHTTQALGGVRPGVDTDVEDMVARFAPVAVGAFAGGRSIAKGASTADRIAAFYEPKIAAAASDAEKVALTTEMRRAMGGVADVAPTAPVDVASGARRTAAASAAIPPRPDVEAPHVTEPPPAPNGEPAGPQATDSRVSADRRTADVPVVAERRMSARRQQIAADMGLPEDHPAVDRIHAGEQSEVVPGVLNRKAWNEQVNGTTQHVASVDIDNLKPVNDAFGHLAGDSLIAANGEALRLAAEEHGAQLAHISGDEFRLAHDDPATLSNAMARANDILREKGVSYVRADGSLGELPPEAVKGFSHGIGTNEAAAEDALRINKAERKASGLRSDRPSGELPQAGNGGGAAQATGEVRAGAAAENAGQAVTPEDQATIDRRANFENYLDTTDPHGNPIEPNAAPSGGEPAGPQNPSVAEWMLGGRQEAYPGIGQDLAHMEAQTAGRGGEPNAAPPNEPPLVPRGPGEAPTQQNPMTAKIRNSTPARLYDRTMPQIVDAIEKQGPTGAQTAAKMRAAARFSDQFSAPAISDLKAATKGMTDAQINQIGDIVENFSKDGMPANVDQRVAQAVSVIQRDLNTIKAHALGHVADFTPIEDYLPHVGKAPEDMPQNVQNLVQRAGHESGNLTRQRGRSSVRPEGQDLIKALSSYYRGASRYVGELRAFNAADRPALDTALEVAADRAHGEGFDGDLIRRYASKAMGGGQTADPVASKIADTVIAMQAITKPVFAPIRHFQQIRNDLAVFGLGNTLQGTLDTLAQKAHLSPEGARAALESGAVARDAANDLMQNITSQGRVVSTLRKGANIANAPVRLVDQIKSQLTANAAAHHFTELADLAQGKSVSLARRANPAGSGFADLRSTPVVQQAARDALTRAGVDVAKLADPAAYRQGMLNYMWQATQDTQKMTNRMGSPAFSMTPWGRVLYTFNRPAAFGTDFAVQRVLKPAVAGDLGPLVRYTVGSLIGYGASEAAVHAIRGKPDEGVNIVKGETSPKQVAKFAAKAVLPHGLSADYEIRGLHDKPVLNFAATHSGAAGGEISDLDAIGRTGKNLYHGEDHPWEPLLQAEGHARTIRELARFMGKGGG